MNVSKSQRLIYVVIILWVAYGILGIYYNVSLPELAGYYASLTLFVSTYLWGEYKRSSDKTPILIKGDNSARETIIYVTIILWNILGIFGIIKHLDINNLTVYFSSLAPFVSSYIIYKTNKGAELPIFNGKSQSLVDNNISNAKSSNKTSFNSSDSMIQQEPINNVYQDENIEESTEKQPSVTPTVAPNQVTEDTF